MLPSVITSKIIFSKTFVWKARVSETFSTGKSGQSVRCSSTIMAVAIVVCEDGTEAATPGPRASPRRRLFYS